MTEDDQNFEKENGRYVCPKCGADRFFVRGFMDGKFTSGNMVECTCGLTGYIERPRDFEDYCFWDDEPTVEKYNAYMQEHFPEMVITDEKLSSIMEAIGEDYDANSSSCEDIDFGQPTSH